MISIVKFFCSPLCNWGMQEEIVCQCDELTRAFALRCIRLTLTQYYRIDPGSPADLQVMLPANHPAAASQQGTMMRMADLFVKEAGAEARESAWKFPVPHGQWREWVQSEAENLYKILYSVEDTLHRCAVYIDGLGDVE